MSSLSRKTPLSIMGQTHEVNQALRSFLCGKCISGHILMCHPGVGGGLFSELTDAGNVEGQPTSPIETSLWSKQVLHLSRGIKSQLLDLSREDARRRCRCILWQSKQREVACLVCKTLQGDWTWLVDSKAPMAGAGHSSCAGAFSRPGLVVEVGSNKHWAYPRAHAAWGLQQVGLGCALDLSGPGKSQHFLTSWPR